MARAVFLSAVFFASLCLLPVLAVTVPRSAATFSAPSAPQPAVHLFLVAGQSNSVGYNTDPFTPEDAIVDRIWQLQICDNNGTTLPPHQSFLNVSSEPLMPCEGAHVSFARSFARSLLPSLGDDDVVFLVPTGISGTGFFDNVWNAYNGSGFVQAVERLHVTWRRLHEDSHWQRYNISWSGVLWHQGEHDAGDNFDGNVANTSYYLDQDITPMVEALRNTSYIHFTSPSLPVVVGQMLPSWLNNVSHSAVRAGVKVALAMVTQYVPYTGFADSYGLLGDPYYTSGLDNEVIHFTARSQRILGKRYYAAYQAALVNYPEQPPEQSPANSGVQRVHHRHVTPMRKQRSDATPPASASQAASPSAPVPAIGVCMSGLEDGDKIPGQPGTDYSIPQVWEYQYFASKHLTMVRLPFRWERMQPTLSGPLDTFMVSVIHSQLAIAAALNMTLLLDCHNYARYGDYVINGTTGPLTSAVFADLWLRMATEFGSSAGLHGYDLQNEPHDMPDLHVWPQAAQAAIDAIRTVDTHTPIYVEGNQWSGAQQWSDINPDFPLTDPNNNIVYSTHCYLDRDGSGTHFNWQEELTHNVTVHIGQQRLANFIAWKAKYNVRAHLGEMGAGYDDDGWFEALDLSLEAVRGAGMEMTYWGAGPFFLEYPMGVDVATVQGRPQDKRQMAVLTKYAHSPPNRENAYWLSGPTTGTVGTASANFTLDVRTYIPAMAPVVTFQCYDSVSADSFWSTDTSGHEFNYWVNFTYTAEVAGVYQVFCVNDADWLDAPAVVYTAS